jgi:hypothetical protein
MGNRLGPGERGRRGPGCHSPSEITGATRQPQAETKNFNEGANARQRPLVTGQYHPVTTGSPLRGQGRLSGEPGMRPGPLALASASPTEASDSAGDRRGAGPPGGPARRWRAGDFKMHLAFRK